MGQCADNTAGETAGRHPDAEDADGQGMERGTDADRGARPQGQCVRADLDHPRWIEVLPNGDVLIAEA